MNWDWMKPLAADISLNWCLFLPAASVLWLLSRQVATQRQLTAETAFRTWKCLVPKILFRLLIKSLLSGKLAVYHSFQSMKRKISSKLTDFWNSCSKKSFKLALQEAKHIFGSSLLEICLPFAYLPDMKTKPRQQKTSRRKRVKELKNKIITK